MVVELNERSASFVHTLAGANNVTPAVTQFGSRSLEGTNAEGFANDVGVERYQCATLLRPGEYQLLLVEAPNVPPVELKSAIRWSIKDMLDYHVDDATIDVLDIPPDTSRGGGRNHSMYAVAAKNELIEARIKQFEAASIPISVIDIAETAQRNIGALYEESQRGLALLYPGEDASLLTVTFNQELFLARRFEIGLSALRSAREETLGNMVLELQRTLDLFDRQFPHVPVPKLLVAPLPEEFGLDEALGRNVGIEVEAIDFSDTLSFGRGSAPDSATQWRLFHLFGASLRVQTKVL
jgi:MSHA biogenesis protein MshI